MINPQDIFNYNLEIPLEPVSFDNWDIKIYGKDTRYPFIVVDNWYLPHEEDAVWTELEFYLRNPFIFESADDPQGVAARIHGVSQAKNKRLFLGKLYQQQNTSHINYCLYKQRYSKFNDILLENCLPYYRSFEACNAESTMVSFYNHDDYYHTHYDCTAWTCLIWMVDESKRFDGGDFEFTEINHKIELKNNRMVMFPSCFLHKVYPLKFHDIEDKSIGKYTITHFYLHLPSNVAINVDNS